jgi:hypothetical protein
MARLEMPVNAITEALFGAPRELHDYITDTQYPVKDTYTPKAFALFMLNFIKMVHMGNPSENKTPVMHLKMLDNFISDKENTINVCHRGAAKSTLKHYIMLMCGCYGQLPLWGPLDYGLYVSDSIDNGVKKMRKSLETSYHASPFLQEMIPNIKFTDTRWEFINADGKHTVFTGHGAQSGVRGTRELNMRPQLALLDDLLSSEDARSKTCLAAVRDTIYNEIMPALHPEHRKVIWSGTPFSMADPLTQAVGSGAWEVNVFPLCEKFPCDEADFRSSWPDRFKYKFVKGQYDLMKANGKLDAFYQEYMLQVVSDEDRVVTMDAIQWYSRADLLRNKQNFNFYVTTDYAVTEEDYGDDSVALVWGYNNIGQWFLVDGYAKPLDMGVNIDRLFDYAQMYGPQSVGIEISGQQKGFVSWIKREMMNRNVYFNLAKDEGSTKEGLSPKGKNKLSRFQITAPMINAGMMHLPVELKNSPLIIEMLHQLGLVTYAGMKSKKDDILDGIAQLSKIQPWKPAAEMDFRENDGFVGDAFAFVESSDMDSYIVN